MTPRRAAAQPPSITAPSTLAGRRAARLAAPTPTRAAPRPSARMGIPSDVEVVSGSQEARGLHAEVTGAPHCREGKRRSYPFTSIQNREGRG